MNPNKNLTGKQTAIIIGSILATVTVLPAIVISCSPQKPIVTQPPSQQVTASPPNSAAAPLTASPQPKTIQGQFIRTGEDFRYETPADIELGNDGIIYVATEHAWQTTARASKSQYHFAFKPDGRWTEQETTDETTAGKTKTYSFTYEGSYTIVRADGTAQISANADDAPRPTGQPWITVTFSEPGQ
jgi:hypothetical protein